MICLGVERTLGGYSMLSKQEHWGSVSLQPVLAEEMHYAVSLELNLAQPKLSLVSMLQRGELATKIFFIVQERS